MKNPTSYLKMRILGAIDYAEGKTIAQRIKHLAGQTFIDEDGHPRTFTWRTISTWLYRYKSRGGASQFCGLFLAVGARYPVLKHPRFAAELSDWVK